MKKKLTIKKILFLFFITIIALIICAEHFSTRVNVLGSFLGLDLATRRSMASILAILIIISICTVGFWSYRKRILEKNDIIVNFFNNTDEAIIIVNKNLILNCNNKAMKILKAYNINDLKGKNINEFINTNLISFNSKNNWETKYVNVSTLDGEYIKSLVSITWFFSNKKKLLQINIHDNKLISSINRLSNDEENLLSFISQETNIGFFNWNINTDCFKSNNVFQNLTSSFYVNSEDFMNSSKLHPEDRILLKNEMNYCMLKENYDFTLKLRLANEENEWKWHTLKAKHSNIESINHIMGILTHFNDYNSSDYKYNLLENQANIGSMKFDRQNKIYQDFSQKSIKILNIDTGTLFMEENIFYNLFNYNYSEHEDEEKIFTLIKENRKIKLLHVRDKESNNRYDNCLIFDITDSWQKEEELYKTSFAVNKSPEEIYFTDTEGYIIYANASARKTFGISVLDYNVRKIMDFNTNIDSRWWNQMLLPNINKDKIFSFESSLKSSRMSSIKYLEIQNNLISNRENQYICSFVRDISSRKKFEEDLKHLASHDQLSKIYNRTGIYENMQKMFIKEKFAVIMIDLDNFKPVNDTYGHDAGDMIIATLAKRLSTSGPYNSIAGRLSGDEFIMIVPNYGSNENLEEIIKGVYHSITQKYIISQGVCKVDASIGISLYPEDGSSRLELFRKADEAMYYVKTRGKSGYTFYNNII